MRRKSRIFPRPAARPGAAPDAIKAGVNSYIVKPFTVESLGEKINQTHAKIGAAA